MNTKLIGGLFILVLTALVSGCTFGKPKPNEFDKLNRSEFDNVISVISLPATPEFYVRHGASTEGSIINEDGVAIRTNNEPFSAQRRLTEFLVLQPNEGEVWPGNVVQSRGLSQGQLNPVGLRFTERQITVDVPRLNPNAPSFTRTVAHASYGETLDMLGTILRDLPAATPAEMAFEKQRVFSSNQAFFTAGLKADWPGGNLSAMISNISSESRTNMLYRFDQVYYTASAMRPSSPSSFLESGVRLSQIRNYISDDNPPAYVSSVTYGRRIYILVQSSLTEQDITDVFNASFNALLSGGDVSLSTHQQNVYSSSLVRVVVIGGAANEGANIIENPTFESLVQVIKNGANFSNSSPAKPLSYTIRYLRDNSIAAVGIPGDWTAVREHQLAYRKPFRATLVNQGFVFTDTADNDEDLHWSLQLHALGQNDQILETFKRTMEEKYVEEYGKDEDSTCLNNCFYIGESLYVNQPVFALSYEVTVESRDGDGKQWGTNNGTIRDITQSDYTISGGNDGEWKIYLQFSSN